jgi:hypothetical protein
MYFAALALHHCLWRYGFRSLIEIGLEGIFPIKLSLLFAF